MMPEERDLRFGGCLLFAAIMLGAGVGLAVLWARLAPHFRVEWIP